MEGTVLSKVIAKLNSLGYFVIDQEGDILTVSVIAPLEIHLDNNRLMHNVTVNKAIQDTLALGLDYISSNEVEESRNGVFCRSTELKFSSLKMTDISRVTKIVDTLLLNSFNRFRNYRGIALDYKGLFITKEGSHHLYRIDVPLKNLLAPVSDQKKKGIDSKFIDAITNYYLEDKWSFTKVHVELCTGFEELRFMFYSTKSSEELYSFFDEQYEQSTLERAIDGYLRCSFKDKEIGRLTLQASVDEYLSENCTAINSPLPEFVLEKRMEGEAEQLVIIWQIPFELSKEQADELKTAIQIAKTNTLDSLD